MPLRGIENAFFMEDIIDRNTWAILMKFPGNTFTIR